MANKKQRRLRCGQNLYEMTESFIKMVDMFNEAHCIIRDTEETRGIKKDIKETADMLLDALGSFVDMASSMAESAGMVDEVFVKKEE